MIPEIGKSGIGIELDEETKRYIDKKIGRLDRFIPRRARESTRVEVKLSETGGRGGDKYACEAVLHMPHESVAITESTLNLLAAVDIVEAKLKIRLKKYKDSFNHDRRIRRRSWIKNINIFKHSNNVSE